MTPKRVYFVRRVREIAASLRGFERLAAAVAAASLALVLLEGASVRLLVPLLESFRPGAEARLRLLVPAVGVLIALRAGAAYLSGVGAARLQLRVQLGLRESLAAALYRSRYADLAALGPGKLVNLFSLQTERVVGGIAASVALLNAVLLLAVYGAALLLLSWRLSLAAAFLGTVGFAVVAYAGRRIRGRSVRMVRAEEDSSQLVLDDVAGLHLIQAYDIPRERLALHREVNERLYREAMGLHRWRCAVRPATELLFAVSLLTTVWIMLALWPDRLFAGVPVLLAFAFVLQRLQGQFAAISDGWATLAEQEGAAFNVFAFLEVRAAGESDGPETLPDPVRRLTVEDVGFRYPGGEPVLRDVDLELRRGEVVAVVGASGAGKSTLAQLLVRLRAPQAGRIAVDGVPLDRVARASLARNLGVVFEDAFVFDETVEWNVSLGRDLPASAVADALRAAGLAKVVAMLPEGIRARVGPRGGTLSAGQRQRLALARAIVTRPQLLILDEATSALDAPSEQSIAEGIRALRPAGITLLIAHRLSTVLTADRILMLEGGRIVAAGRHEELLEASPAYRRLVETQLIERAPTAVR